MLLSMIIAIIGLVLPGLLHDDYLPGWGNGLIALAVLAACSYFMAVTNSTLTGDLNKDAGLYLVAASTLLAGPLQPLQEYLKSIPVLSSLLPGMAGQKEE